MKVVILCGGLGSRLSEETKIKPKPLVEIGNKPILWHIMKYYKSFNINNFVLALGYKGKMIEIPPGKSMPKHSHEGLEATMVFHGGYKDETGDYHKGDMVICSGDEVHSPISSDVTGCLCLVIYSGSLKFKGILGSISNLSKF